MRAKICTHHPASK